MQNYSKKVKESRQIVAPLFPLSTFFFGINQANLKRIKLVFQNRGEKAMDGL